MDVCPTLIANGQAAELPEPGQGPFDHPAVPSQPLARVDPFARNAHLDVAAGQGSSAAPDVVGLVGMELGGSFAGSSPWSLDRRDGIEEGLEDRAVMGIGPGQAPGEGYPSAVRNNMALRARFAAVRRVRTGGGAPLLAGMLALSRQARSHSI